MADASASLPSPVQQDRKNQLESDRLRAGQSSSLPSLDGRNESKEDKAQKAVSQGLDTLSNAPDPRVKAAAMAAKAVGADKMLAKNKNVQSAAELLAAAQSGDLKAAIRAGGKNWKNNVLWPTFVANVFVEPLSAFAFTFVCIQVYCMGSFMLGDILEPPSTNEYVAIAILSCCQVIIILGILLLSYVVFCLVNPICAVDVFGSAVAKSLLEPLGIKF